MASKYSSTVFVTFLLVLSLANASPIFSILQLPATLGNLITDNLMLLNKIPIISQIIGGHTTTTSASIVHAPVPTSSSQATTGVGGATGTSPGIANPIPVVAATSAPVAGASPGIANPIPVVAATSAPVAGASPGIANEIPVVAATAAPVAGASPGIATQTPVVAATTAPVIQAPSPAAVALQPSGGVSEAAINGDVSATGTSTAAVESPAG